MERINDDDWVPTKRAELDEIIAACLGLHMEASTSTAVVSPGQTLPVKIDAINRSSVPVEWASYRFPTGETVQVGAPLTPNQLLTKEANPTVAADTPYSQPYWLRKPSTVGTFTVDDQDLIGRPINPPHFPTEVVLKVNGREISYTLDTRYRTVDPIAGEVREEIVIAPPVFANFADPVLVFPDHNAKTVRIRVIASDGPVKGEVRAGRAERVGGHACFDSDRSEERKCRHRC